MEKLKKERKSLFRIEYLTLIQCNSFAVVVSEAQKNLSGHCEMVKKEKLRVKMANSGEMVIKVNSY